MMLILVIGIGLAVMAVSYWVAEDVYLEYQDKQLKAPGGFLGLYILTLVILSAMGSIAWGIGELLVKLVVE